MLFSLHLNRILIVFGPGGECEHPGRLMDVETAVQVPRAVNGLLSALSYADIMGVSRGWLKGDDQAGWKYSTRLQREKGTHATR